MIYPQMLLDLNREIIVDLFAGGGGASCGIEMALGRTVDVAVNHDPAAVAMHRINHPQTVHHRADVFEVDPREVTGGRPVGLLWASPDCFPAGTLILTDRGYRPIEEIEVGEQVLTHQSRYRRVTETMSTRRPLVTVRGQGHPGISVSPEHPFYARAAHNVWNTQERRYDRTLGEPTWTKASDLRTAGAPMNAAGGDLSFWATPCLFPSLPIPEVGGRGMEINPALMWLAGRYLGDGWTRLTDSRGELVITCAKGEAEGLRAWLNCWPRTGARAGASELAWHERETGTAYQFSSSHRGLVEWLRSEFGHGAASKSIPAWALGMDPMYRRLLLDGYLSADGHTREISGGDIDQCSTVSKALAFGLRSLAESLGYSVNVNGPYDNRTSIEGREFNALPMWTVKWRRLLQRSQNEREGLHNWTRVRSVEDEDRVATVFNLSVEEDESYVAEGIVVHNCTYHSKARGAKPIRHKNRKRRALAWVVTRWAGQVRPRVIMLENVEEFAEWGPLVGPPDALRPCPKRRGRTFRKWVRSLERLGYQVEWRERRACDSGAPTIRKRLYLIARCDGQPIVWPEPTHGPKGSGLMPYRTAAECIDWSIPMLSIFATRDEAKAWGKAHGQAAPKRPLAEATMRRVARGVMRYVVENPEPYIVGVGGRAGQSPERSLDDPYQTITTKGDAALVAPVITKFRSGSTGHAADEPLHTVTANSYQKRPGGATPLGLVAPVIVPVQNAGSAAANSGSEPLRTITAHPKGGGFALAAPVIVPNNTNNAPHPVGDPLATVTGGGRNIIAAAGLIPRYGERDGQAPRTRSVEEPHPVIVPTGNGGSLAAVHLSPYHAEKHPGEARGSTPDRPIDTLDTSNRHAVVAGFLAKHYGDTGQRPGSELSEPVSTVTSSDHNALVTANLTKLRGTSSDADISEPLHTISAGGTHHGVVAAHIQRDFGQSIGHAAETPLATITADRGGHTALVASFLQSYYGTGNQQSPGDPLFTIPSHDRFGVVTVDVRGEPYILADIAMRMLQPGELYAAQGFPGGYIYDRGIDEEGRVVRFTKTEQVRMCGNSVSPYESCALAGGNLPELVVRDEALPPKPRARRARKAVACA